MSQVIGKVKGNQDTYFGLALFALRFLQAAVLSSP